MTDSNSNYSDLPQGWKWVTLNDIANIKYGKNLAIKSLLENGKHPVFGANGIIGYYNVYHYETEQVLISCRGAYSGTINYSPPKCFITNNSLVLDIINRDTYKKYLYYSLQSIDKTKLVTGTAQPQVTVQNASHLLVPLPPLPEQHRIVEKIEELFSELDNGVASLKKALEQLKTYRQAVLKWAFEGKLTEKWRNTHQDSLEDADTLLEQIKAERKRHYQQQLEDWKQALKEWENNGKETKKPTKPQQPKDLPPLTKEELSNLPSLPDGWMWLNFGELISEGPQNGLYKPASCYGQGTLIVRIDNFYDGKLNSWKTFKRLQIDENELNIYHLDQGDILINRVNSMTYIGKCSLVNNIPESCVFESNIMRIKISYRSCNSQFLIYYLSSCRGLKELRKNAKQAVNQASINQQDVTLSLIPICSMQEQTQIVQEIESRLSVCDQLEATLTENLDKAEALRQSILKRAFEGKLVL
jgi:type I restriction enzyme S subunit